MEVMKSKRYKGPFYLRRLEKFQGWWLLHPGFIPFQWYQRIRVISLWQMVVNASGMAPQHAPPPCHRKLTLSLQQLAHHQEFVSTRATYGAAESRGRSNALPPVRRALSTATVEISGSEITWVAIGWSQLLRSLSLRLKRFDPRVM